MSPRGPAAVLALAGALAVPALAEKGAPPPAATPAPYWLRLYPPQPYSEYWHLKLRVADMEKASAAVQSALKRQGGKLAAPLSQMAYSREHKYQQMSFQVPARSAEKALRAIQGLGALEFLAKNPGFNGTLARERKEKLDGLQADMSAHRDELSRMPAVSALAGEMLAHLQQAETMQRQAADKVLFNVELQQSP